MIKKKIVVIGGGTGTVAVLSGLKRHADLELSVIVNMTDDGGSNKVVRDEFGLLPLSDLRKSIIALANAGNGMFRNLFTYRFEKGEGLSGHTLGNLIMMALSDITGSEVGAIEAASKIFNVQGKVIPVTLDDVRLTAEYDSGKKITGEHLIDEPEDQGDARIINFSTTPSGKIYPEAQKAILEADYIVAGPGDLYTSTLANIVIEGVPQAIQQSKAKYIFINNLMTKKGQTHWMKAKDLVNEMNKYVGRVPDVVLMNNGEIPEDVLEKYEAKNEFVIEDNLDDKDGYRIFRTDLISDEEEKYQKGDKLVRSLIRHDSDKLEAALYELCC